MKNENKAVALEAYEVLAENYAERIDTKPHNAYYERPATLSLLSDMQDKHVLDAGCGPGTYAELLAENGAHVVAFDISKSMVRLAKQRLGKKAQVLQADLGKPLNFLESEYFDVVLSALAMDYVSDWRSVLGEFHRVLRGGGNLVFSVEHPSSTFVRHVYFGESNYFETEKVSVDFIGFDEPISVPYFRRPLGDMLNALIEAGFCLEKVIEPTPTEQFRRADPENHEKLSRMPGFLCVKAVKLQ